VGSPNFGEKTIPTSVGFEQNSFGPLLVLGSLAQKVFFLKFKTESTCGVLSLEAAGHEGREMSSLGHSITFTIFAN